MIAMDPFRSELHVYLIGLCWLAIAIPILSTMSQSPKRPVWMGLLILSVPFIGWFIHPIFQLLRRARERLHLRAAAEIECRMEEGDQMYIDAIRYPLPTPRVPPPPYQQLQNHSDGTGTVIQTSSATIDSGGTCEKDAAPPYHSATGAEESDLLTSENNDMIVPLVPIRLP